MIMPLLRVITPGLAKSLTPAGSGQNAASSGLQRAEKRWPHHLSAAAGVKS